VFVIVGSAGIFFLFGVGGLVTNLRLHRVRLVLLVALQMFMSVLKHNGTTFKNNLNFVSFLYFRISSVLTFFPDGADPASYQWVRGAKRQGRVVYHSPPSSAEIKKSKAILPLPHTCLHGGVLN
jgi:hypothetical protein